MTSQSLSWVMAHPWISLFGAAAAFFLMLTLFLSVRYIPNTRVGIVEKLISGRGSVASGLIALNGEVGIVTVHDGPSLASEEIIAPTVGEDPSQAATYHNNSMRSTPTPARSSRFRRPISY